jgi:hypothetical protein
MDQAFLAETTEFLRSIVSKLGPGQPIGDKVLSRWLKQKATGVWTADKETYRRVRNIVTIVKKRTQPLPTVTKGIYSADRKRLAS